MTDFGHSSIKLAIIVPVYNRPAEIEELLESLCKQTSRIVEIIIVEDGSTLKCDQQVARYAGQLNIKYFFKENTGPGLTRNYGVEKAEGNYVVFLDSDCVLPEQYVQTVQERLVSNYIDAFGGPDRAAENFTVLQKAINYAMTSFLTTGGIRGGGEKLDIFYPRSFNMGFSKEVYEKTGGFPAVQFANTKAAGEDIELSIHIRKLGFSVDLIKEAYVYHKRRTSYKQFFRQTYNFGMARVLLSKRNPGTGKLMHTFPSLFLLGILFLIVLSILVSPLFLLPLILFATLVFVDSTIRNNSLLVGLNSIWASYIQLIGYGAGFLGAFWKRIVLSK
jgi:glycosyltransferase involved in cell wall biosynthesis